MKTIVFCAFKEAVQIKNSRWRTKGDHSALVMNFESNTVIEIDSIEFCAYLQ